MRSVWRLRTVTFVALLAVAALLLLLARGANEAEAAPFDPTGSVALSPTNAAGAVADIILMDDWGNVPTPSREFPSSFSNFTPAGWGMPAADTPLIPIGTRTGTATAITTLGILNSACAIGVPISFSGGSQPPLSLPTTALLDASTNPLDVIPSGAGFANLIADSNPADAIMDGAQHWNDLLAALNLPAPRERQVVTTNLFGTTIWVDILTYDPGLVAPAKLGFAQLNIVQNFSPALPATPGLITDSCGLKTTITQEGLAANGAAHRTNPGPNFATGGTEIFFGVSTSGRDADSAPGAVPGNEPTGPDIGGRFPPGGFVNSDDTCPFTPNVGSTHFPVGTGDDIGFAGAPESPAGDGIDAACDANPTVFDGSDADGDFFLNRADNCPQVSNPSQSDVLELAAGPPVDGGPPTDGIGDACDLNPTVPDGHFHTVLIKKGFVCITAPFPGFADSDGDGFCDATEVGLGSNPGNPASIPEVLAIPSQCDTGLDDDGDGLIDLQDPGCRLPPHDIDIKKVVGATDTCGTDSPKGGYNIILSNEGPADPETVEIAILVDPVPGTGGSGPQVTKVRGATVTTSGPINIDGDTDVEFLVKAEVSGVKLGASTTVQFKLLYPPCGAGPDVTPVDYVLLVDACHADDIFPLGPFGAEACGAPADGGQDTNTANDGPVAVLVNDLSK